MNNWEKLLKDLREIKNDDFTFSDSVAKTKGKSVHKISHYIFYHNGASLVDIKPSNNNSDIFFVNLDNLDIPEGLKVDCLTEQENKALFSEYLGILQIKPETEMVGTFTYSIPLKFNEKAVEGGAPRDIFLPKIKFDYLKGKSFDNSKIYGVEFSSYNWNYEGAEIIRDVTSNPKFYIPSEEVDSKGPFKGSIIVNREDFLEFQKWFLEVTKYVLLNYGWTCNLKPGAFETKVRHRDKESVDYKIRGFGHIQERLMAYYFGRKFKKENRVKLGEFLNSCSCNLITQYFETPNAERQEEIDNCLRKNCINPYISKIYLLVEKSYEGDIFKHPKIEQIVLGHRLKFSEAFEFANKKAEGQTFILANADIYFDETIEKIEDYNLDSSFLILTRHNHFVDGRDQLILGYPKYNQYKIQKNFDEDGGYIEWGSQDAWIFKPKVKNALIESSNFEIGRLHCDSHLAWILRANGYKVFNPCFEIVARHLHNVFSGISREDIDRHLANQIYGIKYPINPDGSTVPANRTWVQGSNPKDKIKIYSLSTPSHKVLLERYFLSSMKDDYFLILKEYEQECQSGAFFSEGWMKTMTKKIEMVIEAIKENQGKIFIHSDVDIQFFDKTKNLILDAIEGKDIVFLRDSPVNDMARKGRSVYCAGFFACKGSEKTLKLFEEVLAMIPNSQTDDQTIMNQLIKNSGKYDSLKIDYLPECFYSPGIKMGSKKWVWTPGEELDVPENIVLHHGNWTVGLENKKKQLDYVRGIVFRRKGFI